MCKRKGWSKKAMIAPCILTSPRPRVEDETRWTEKMTSSIPERPQPDYAAPLSCAPLPQLLQKGGGGRQRDLRGYGSQSEGRGEGGGNNATQEPNVAAAKPERDLGLNACLTRFQTLLSTLVSVAATPVRRESCPV